MDVESTMTHTKFEFHINMNAVIWLLVSTVLAFETAIIFIVKTSALLHTTWPNKDASIFLGIIFHKLISKNEKLFHNKNQYGFIFYWWNSEQNPPKGFLRTCSIL